MFPTTGRAEIKVRAPNPVNVPSENKEKEPVEADLRSDTATSPTKSICPKRCTIWDFRFQQNDDFISPHRERLEKEGKWKELAILDGYDIEMFQEMADNLEWESQQRHRIDDCWTTDREQGINYGQLHSSKSLLDKYHYWSW